MASLTIFRKKIQRYLQIRSALRYAKFFLANGLYVVEERTMRKIQEKHKKRNFDSFYIYCKAKLIRPVENLYFVINKYKFIFVSEEKSFFYIKKRKRYNIFKNRYYNFGKKLFYNHINLEFFDKRKLVVSNTAFGIKFKKHERFNDVTKLIFETALQSKAITKNIIINNKNYSIPFYIQHGDFKDSNIVWDGNNYCLIDLEEIGFYPILFDLFFYVFISKPNAVIDIVFSTFFVKSVKSVWEKLDKSISFKEDYMFIDYSISIYLSYLLQMFRTEHTKEFFDYYLFWTSSDFLKDERLTLTQLIIDSELYADKLYLKKNKRKN